jgi:hypothetical protein
MDAPLRRLADLSARLEELPPPPPGHVRVYRGQNADFPAMLPSSCRPGAPATGLLWDVALLRLRDRAAGLAQEEDAMATVRNIGFWYKVLAQHYGPGSPFLDVTTSPEVALWFALNRVVEGSGRSFHLARPGMVGSTPVRCTTLTFGSHVDAPGWFYVLDVPRWDGERVPGHGELVDLSRGPAFVTDCPRVRLQHGGLVLGDVDRDGGDLSGFYACSPIPVARDFHDVPLVDEPAEALFPDPGTDPLYGRLLEAPLVPAPGEAGVEYRQSLDVYVVAVRGGDDEILAILERQADRMPPLVRAAVRAIPELRDALRSAMDADPEAATVVQVEPPLLSTLPPADRWNQSALATGLGERVQPRIEGSDRSLPAVDLRSFMVELSPLEYAFEELEEEDAPLAATWLVRRDDRVHFMTLGAGAGGRTWRRSNALEIRFSATEGRFECLLDDGWAPLREMAPGVFVKAFFITLDVVRGLSRSVKPDAFPHLTTGVGDRIRSVLSVRAVSTVLSRSRADPEDLRLHFLRYADTLAPYMGPRLETPAVADLSLVTDRPYDELGSLREIYGHTHEVVLRGPGVTLEPERDGPGFSPAVADHITALLHP